MTLELTATEFAKFQSFIYDSFGIVLPEAKRDMLANRLRQMLVTQGFGSFNEYYEARLKHPSAKTLEELINRVSTNHTYFYREPRHFEHLTKVALGRLTSAAKARSASKPEFRCWCAAASTGQEPFGLAIQLREYWGREYSTWSAGLLATDISERALSAAAKGTYTDDDVAPLPKDILAKYFQRTATNWTVCKQLRDDVLFRRFNLMNTSLPFQKPFDVIFCRNVMIYFDDDTRRNLVARLHDALYPGGYLYVGLAESLGRNAGALQIEEPGVYRRKP